MYVEDGYSQCYRCGAVITDESLHQMYHSVTSTSLDVLSFVQMVKDACTSSQVSNVNIDWHGENFNISIYTIKKDTLSKSVGEYYVNQVRQLVSQFKTCGYKGNITVSGIQV